VERDEAALGAPFFDAPGRADIDGDGAADVCARAAAGIKCALSSGSTLSVGVAGPALTNDAGWDDLTNFATLRLGDVTGDGKADLCARSNNGVTCWPSTGDGFGAPIAGPELSDAVGWNKPQYYSTLRLADVDGDGKDDVCARRGGLPVRVVDGERLRRDDPDRFYADAQGWGEERFYGTIRMGDVDGDGRADVCARANSGMSCHLSTGSGFGPGFGGPAWSDASGFDDVSAWSTIRMGDIDGDGRADLCARKPGGVACHLSVGDGFGPAIAGPALSDESGWSGADNYPTLRLADIDGDNRDDICARANARAFCWKTVVDDAGAVTFTRVEGRSFFSDEAGFDAPGQFRTFRVSDVNGDHKADVCGRDAAGFSCFLSTGYGFGDRVDGPRWTNDNGWSAMKYSGTLLLSSTPRCAPEPEVCDGLDNDCSGMADDHGACTETHARQVMPAPDDTGPDRGIDADEEPRTPAGEGGCSSTGAIHEVPSVLAVALAIAARRRGNRRARGIVEAA
jgi:hypothetical protein